MGIKQKILEPHFLNEFPWAFFSPFYIHRKLLHRSLKDNSHYLSGYILDYGCGSKPYESLFKATKYIGIDIENPGHPHQHESVDIMFDGTNIPFESNTFDSCLASEVFEHVLDPKAMLREIHRVLKPNGSILLTTPFVWDEHETPYDFYRYTSFGLNETLRKNGFKIERYEKLGNFHELLLQIILIKLNRIFSRFKASKILFVLFMCPLVNIFSILSYSSNKEKKSIFLGHTIIARKLNAE